MRAHFKRTPNVRAECCSTGVHSFPLTLRSLTKSWSATPRSLLSTKPPLTNDDFFREPGKCQHPNTKKEIYFSQNYFSKNGFVLFEKSCRHSARILSQKYIIQILYREEALHPLANPIHPIQAPSHPIRSDIHDQTDMYRDF